MNATKRELLLALGALSVGAIPSAAFAQDTCPAIDPETARAIGEAYLASRPDADVDALRRALTPDGGCDLAALGQRAADDFRRNAFFEYRGWRLSETEGALFAVFSRT